MRRDFPAWAFARECATEAEATLWSFLAAAEKGMTLAWHVERTAPASSRLVPSLDEAWIAATNDRCMRKIVWMFNPRAGRDETFCVDDCSVVPCKPCANKIRRSYPSIVAMIPKIVKQLK